jgi:hypothetical protein
MSSSRGTSGVGGEDGVASAVVAVEAVSVEVAVEEVPVLVEVEPPDVVLSLEAEVPASSGGEVSLEDEVLVEVDGVGAGV